VFGYDSEQIHPGSLSDYLEKNKRPYPKNQNLSNDKSRIKLGIRMTTIDEALLILKNQIYNTR
jgi:hypothetical protein